MSLDCTYANAGAQEPAKTCRHCHYSIGIAQHGDFAGKYVHVLTGNVLCALVAEPIETLAPIEQAGKLTHPAGCICFGCFVDNQLARGFPGFGASSAQKENVSGGEQE